MRALFVACVLTIAGCAHLPNSQVMKWPERGALVRVENGAPHALHVVLEDGRGRLLDKGRIAAYGARCMRWPWVDEDGRVLFVAGADTIASGWFKPWAFERWTYALGDSVPQARKGAGC